MSVAMDQYIIQYRDIRDNWKCDDLGWETPNTKAEAVTHYKRLRDEYGRTAELRVLFLDGETNSFADVTLSIEGAVEEELEQVAQWAREDAAHERQESMRGVFV